MSPGPVFSNIKTYLTKTTHSHDLIFFSHAFLAFIFYSNYFLFNQPLICSTDVINLNFPVLLTAKYNFWNGSLGLWNPYLLNGVSAFSSSNAPIFSPDNWILFLFSDKYFFLAATFFSFIKMWLIGVFSYLIFKEEFKDTKWAFFASLVYQLSGYTVWSTMIFDVLSMYLFTTIAIYLIWTLHRRKQYANYTLLTLVLLVNMLSTNISYASYSMILIGVLFLYRFITERKTLLHVRHFTSFSLGFLTAVSLHLFRLIPVWMETHDSNRSFEFTPDFKDTTFLILRFLIPETFGVNFQNSVSVFKNLGNFFEGWHIQWIMPQFFGVLPALLILWAVFSPQKGRINFWTVYVIIAVSLLIMVEPFETIFKIINPVYHTLSMQIFLPFGFSLLAGYAGKSLEQKSGDFSISQKQWITFIFIFLVIVFYLLSIMFVGHAMHQLALVRLILLVSVVVLFAFYLLSRKFQSLPGISVKFLTLVAAASLLFLLLIFNDSNKTFVFHVKLLSASLLLLMAIFHYLWHLVRKKSISYIYAYIILGLFVIAILFPWTDAVQRIPHDRQKVFLSFMGFARFLIIAVLFMTTLHWIQAKKLKPAWLFPLFLGVFLAEQIPAMKVHSHIVINPFYKYSTPYPAPKTYFDQNGEPMNLDLANYRVNFPNTMLGIPLYNEIYGPNNEILSSIHSIYQIRSYGGHYNMVPTRYFDFISGLIPDFISENVGYGVYERTKDRRFLDLLGIKYAYDPETRKIDTRPNALSRVMLFQNYEVIPDKVRALPRLRSPEFDPIKTIILNNDPRLQGQGQPVPAHILKYTSNNPDDIEVQTKSSGILFLGDSFHKGWKAYINGKQEDVLIADHNFMAVAVPPGNNHVKLVFEPEYFYLGAKVGGASAAVAFLTAILLFVFRNRIDRDGQPILG